MHKLLNAGFYRLIKNKIFWGTIIITLCIDWFCLSNINMLGGSIELLIMNHIGIIGFFISVFTTMFVGLEYANGTIRNKIVSGHSRIKIYISNLIISIIVGLIIEIVYILFIFVIGSRILNKIQLILPVIEFAKLLLHIVLIIVMYSTIFNCITLLCNDITISTVLCIICVFIMFLADLFFSQIVHSEKYKYMTNYNENGEPYREIIGVNPDYPGETKIQIVKIIRNFIPVSQSNQINEVISERVSNKMMNFKNETSDTINLIGYSLGFIIVINVIGIYFFNKKELK